jgi:hypothetical protein
MTSVVPEQHVCGARYGELAESTCKEQFSYAYIRAVAAAARCSYEPVDVDYEQVDATIKQKAPQAQTDHQQIDLQVKCTSQAVLQNDHVTWRLERPHYDSLRNPRRMCNVILVVMVVPEDFESWIYHDEDQLALARCAYWTSLKGMPSIDTEAKGSDHQPIWTELDA